MLNFKKSELKVLLIIIAVQLNFSCKVFNPAEQIPSYISIEKIDLIVAADGTQGSNASKITDAWVYIDEELIGIFELPAKFPVLKEGTHTIRIKPGIKLNGISATRSPYIFYTNFEKTIELKPKEITVIEPTTSYHSYVVFHWLENFETPDYTLKKSGLSEVNPLLNSTNDEAFEGIRCAKINLDASQVRFEASSKLNYVLPKGGTSVFLELNFKTNYAVSVGIYANIPNNITQTSSLILNPTVDSSGNLFWKKIYIELTPEVSLNKAATDYSIFFGTQKSGDDLSKEIVFYLDNIKLLSL